MATGVSSRMLHTLAQFKDMLQHCIINTYWVIAATYITQHITAQHSTAQHSTTQRFILTQANEQTGLAVFS
jgi:hypothetical protein